MQTALLLFGTVIKRVNLQAMGILALPPNAPEALQNLTSLVDEIWYHAGDKSTDVSTFSFGQFLLLLICHIWYQARDHSTDVSTFPFGQFLQLLICHIWYQAGDKSTDVSSFSFGQFLLFRGPVYSYMFSVVKPLKLRKKLQWFLIK